MPSRRCLVLPHSALPLPAQQNCCHTATVLPSRFTHMLGLMTARTTEKRYFFHMETRMKLCAVFLILERRGLDVLAMGLDDFLPLIPTLAYGLYISR